MQTLLCSFFASLLSLICVAQTGLAQEPVPRSATAESVVVTGDELPSAYGAPPAFSRTRFAPATTAYVLPPGSILAATIYEGEAFREGRPAHLFTQEIEVGLPCRFGLAVESSLESFGGTVQAKTVSVEARYALADWNKIPLNPTLFAEYKFGVGRILKEERMEEEEMPEPDALIRGLSSALGRHGRDHRGGNLIAQEDGEPRAEGEHRPDLPDAVEGRLLLAQDFGEKIEWSLNGFIEQETSGDRGREWGFAQSVVVPLTPRETVKAGVEMQYTNFTDEKTRDEPEHKFGIGPTFAWKPARSCRVDVSELFGLTNESSRAQTFVVFSMLLGGPAAGESEAPVSTRNR
jgi:hypothetical protein